MEITTYSVMCVYTCVFPAHTICQSLTKTNKYLNAYWVHLGAYKQAAQI